MRVLRAWFDENRDHPYPDEQEKSRLQDATGLSLPQISRWFTNSRRRRIRPRASSSTLSVPDYGQSGMNALDRWRNSPPALEAASLSAIASAVTRANAAAGSGDDFSADVSLAGGDGWGWTLSASSDQSSWSRSSDASSNSQGSVIEGMNTSTKRRRRRKPLPKRMGMSKTPDGRKFQCTFCTDRFKTKYDWTRHEATQHLSLQQWSCAPSGPRTFAIGHELARCAFCDVQDPSDSHLETHRYTECAQKPRSARTFYRKDHLRQHLLIIHGVRDPPDSIDDWGSTVTHLNCRCGFCGDTFEEWSLRNDHIANHFRNGAHMGDWKGCRGFEPTVAMFVRNAMPPYLIGTESNAIEPFRAENKSTDVAAMDSIGDVEGISADPGRLPTSFEVLVSQLSAYVNEQKRLCLIPTDEMLQRQARLIVYGDDDLWNQTAADNREWLELFKMGHGIHGGEGPLNMCSGTLEPSAVQPDTTFQLPWYWQSPECLAEWRQSQDPFAAGLSCAAQIDQRCAPHAEPAPAFNLALHDSATLKNGLSGYPGNSGMCAPSSQVEHPSQGLSNPNEANLSACLADYGELEDLFGLDLSAGVDEMLPPV